MTVAHDLEIIRAELNDAVNAQVGCDADADCSANRALAALARVEDGLREPDFPLAEQLAAATEIAKLLDREETTIDSRTLVAHLRRVTERAEAWQATAETLQCPGSMADLLQGERERAEAAERERDEAVARAEVAEAVMWPRVDVDRHPKGER